MKLEAARHHFARKLPARPRWQEPGRDLRRRSASRCTARRLLIHAIGISAWASFAYWRHATTIGSVASLACRTSATSFLVRRFGAGLTLVGQHPSGVFRRQLAHLIKQ